ncbi:MAG: OmpA family protein [Odoribacter sp.]|nr:OmpA family protein [Odoribacter sp.]
MKKGIMLTVLITGLWGITQAQTQVEEVIIEQRLPGYKTSFEANPFWHNWFISANFGANAFIAEHSSQAKFKNTITFMPELSLGKMFNPWWGLRLQGGGGSLHGFTYDARQMIHMHYMHLNIDFMMGLINFFAKYKPDRVFDIVPFFGVGGMTRRHQQSFTIHGGVQGKFRLSEHFDANIEFQGMIFDDRMVELGGFPNDGLGGLTAGFTYYFKGRSFRTAPKQEVIEEMAAANLVLANKVNQLQNRPPEIKVVEKEVVKPEEIPDSVIESIPSTIPFKFNSAVIQDVYDPLIYNIGTFMQKTPDAKIRIVGYADKFGPINVNLSISKARAEAVANMLKKEYGISADRMQIEYVGKEKPYYKNNNQWNRCVMVEIIK